MRIIDFVDGFESSTAPTSISLPANMVSNTPSGNLSATDIQAAVNELQGDVDTINNKIGAANGIASLDSGGKVPASQIPAVSIIDVYPVADISARDALTVQEGDVAVVADAGGGVTKTYIYGDSSWIELITDGSLASHIANVSNPHAVTKSQVGLSNVDNTSDATKNSATATLTNKTFGDAPTFTQVSTPTTPSAGFNKIYPKSDGLFYTLNSSGVETQVGSGAGGGAKNYLGTVNNVNGNGNFELGSTSKWSLAHTTLSSLVPNQASGSWTAASGNLSISAVTSGKLAGSYSLSMVSSAASTAGDMLVSDAFTIDAEDQAKVLTFKAYYSATSGSSNINWSGTSANTLQIYIYDVTNSAWIQPAGVYGMTQGSGVGYVTGTFQTTSNSTQYRLAVVNVNASAGAFTILMDDFVVGPVTAPIGAVVTDWVSFTPTGTWTSNTTYTGFKRRVGDSYQYRVLVSLNGGGPNAVALQITIPEAIDTTKLAGGTSSKVILGTARVIDSGVQNYGPYSIIYAGANSVQTYITDSSGTYTTQPNNITSTVPFAFGSGDSVEIEFTVPVVGLSSNVQMSNDTDTRVVAGRFYRNGNTIYNQNVARQQILIDTAVVDTHGMLSGNTVVIPVSGTYRLSAAAYFTGGNISGSGSYTIGISSGSVGGTILTAQAVRGIAAGVPLSVNTSAIVNLTAGTVLYLVVFADINHSVNTITVDGSTNYLTMLNVERLSGSATIAATDTVAARYTNSSGQSIPTGATHTILTNWTKDYDTHSFVNPTSGVVTIPISGKFRISAEILYNSASFSSGNVPQLALFKNGSVFARLGASPVQTTGTNYQFMGGSATVNVLAGDTLDLRTLHNEATSRSLINDATWNHFSIERVGN